MCPECQKSKYDNQRASGLIQPLPVPNAICKEIAMDFIITLQKMNEKMIVLVVIYRLSKYAHFTTLPKKITTMTLAKVFIIIIWKLHSIPKVIIYYKDPIFIRNFWQELFRLSGTTLSHKNDYHPQIDRQTEVTNRTLEQFLKTFMMEEPTKWLSLLP